MSEQEPKKRKLAIPIGLIVAGAVFALSAALLIADARGWINLNAWGAALTRLGG